MIVKDQPSAFSLFVVMNGSVVPQIIYKIIAFTLLSLGIMLFDGHIAALPHISPTALSVFGIALSLFLGFRNNAAYERWWEARKLWGGIIADVRNLAKITDIFVANPDERADILGLAVVFAHMHRATLRDVPVTTELQDWVSGDAMAALRERRNGADAALRSMSHKIRQLHEKASIDNFGQLAFAKNISAFGHAQAGCERIATTPLPFVYSLLIRRTTYLYCILLPFGLLETAGPFVPVFSAIVAYVFFGLQAVTNELEHPFRQVKNGLPLDALCRVIEISVADALERTPPEPLLPKDGVLT